MWRKDFIEDNVVYVMEMYDEQDDFARTLFGIITTAQETLDYWGEYI